MADATFAPLENIAWLPNALACVAGGIVGAREIKLSRQKRAALPREIPPARELGYFEYRPLLSAHWPQLIPINSTN